MMSVYLFWVLFLTFLHMIRWNNEKTYVKIFDTESDKGQKMDYFRNSEKSGQWIDRDWSEPHSKRGQFEKRLSRRFFGIPKVLYSSIYSYMVKMLILNTTVNYSNLPRFPYIPDMTPPIITYFGLCIFPSR